MTDAYILDAVRTARGKAGKGGFAKTKPVDLVAPLMTALAERHSLDTDRIEDVLLGCVTQMGPQGGDIAKTAALYAGWSDRTSGATINRFCASGLSAIADAAAHVMAGANLIAAGGVESLSSVPMFSDEGPWFADPTVREKTRFVHMAVAADLYASLADIPRDALDAYALRSHQRAAATQRERQFECIVEVEGVANDEAIRGDLTIERLAKLPAAYGGLGEQGGDAVALARYPELAAIDRRHTVGTSPAFVDAASLTLVASQNAAADLGMAARARIRSFVNHATEPVLMLDGNIKGAERAMAKANVTASDIDVFEVNESFAVVPLAFERAFDLDPARLNPNGGAIAMGHPLGATGGILVATALDTLERTDGSLALVSIVGGAGVTVTVVLERV